MRNESVVTILNEEFENDKTGEKVQGLTIIVDGKLKQTMDIIIEKYNTYKVANITKHLEAFALCGKLTNIVLLESLTEIGDRAFKHCDMSSATILNSVVSIGSVAFEFCAKLQSITHIEKDMFFEYRDLVA